MIGTIALQGGGPFGANHALDRRLDSIVPQAEAWSEEWRRRALSADTLFVEPPDVPADRARR